MSGIATLTMNPSLDIAVTADRVAPGRKIRCRDLIRNAGGGGINVSRALLRLGGSSVAVYPSGGCVGDLLEELLTQEEVEPRRRVPIQGTIRESVTVTEESGGLQYRFGLPGPKLAESEIEECLAALEDLHPRPDYLVLSGSLPPGAPDELYARVVRSARKHGQKVVLDASGSAAQEAVREGPFVYKPNLRELSHLAGRELPREPDQEEAARQLCLRYGVEAVIVSLGAGGAIAVTRSLRLRLSSPAVPIVSRVGAGDSMVAGMVLALSRGASVPFAAAHGVAAGAAAVMTPGTELCRREDYAQLLSDVLRESGLRES